MSALSQLAADPVSRAARHILGAVFMHSSLRVLVAVGNRQTFAGIDPSPVKENPQHADLPELTIIPAGGQFNPRQNGGVSSSSVSILHRFLIGVVTDEQRTCITAGGINPIKWALFQAVQRIEDRSNSGAVMGLSFMRTFRVADFFDELGRDVVPSAYQRVIEGWAFGVSIETLLVFSREEMLA